MAFSDPTIHVIYGEADLPEVMWSSILRFPVGTHAPHSVIFTSLWTISLNSFNNASGLRSSGPARKR